MGPHKTKISLTTAEKLDLFINLGVLLAAGIPLVEALTSLQRDAKKGESAFIEVIKDDINQGRRLSESFAKFPNLFNSVVINLLKAAEEAGTLEQTLKDLAEAQKKEMSFQKKVYSALTYPIFVVFVFLAIVITVLVFVVPKIATLFLQLNVPLPLPTQILLGISNVIVNYTIPLVGGLIVLTMGIVALYRYKKQEFLNFFYNLPTIRKLIQQIDMAQFTRSMSLLLSSGIPITESLELSENVVLRQDIKEALEAIHQMVVSGKRLSDGFAQYRKQIPSLVVQITQAGEESGKLDSSMQQLAGRFEEQVESELKTITTLLEPIMLVVIGVVMAAIMLSIMGPIYQLIGNITPN